MTSYLILTLISIAIIQPAHAREFILDFEFDSNDNSLDASLLDTHLPNPTPKLWNPSGIYISTKNTTKLVGLFQSNCIPTPTNNAHAIPCGNNGLATGLGQYILNGKQINFDTEPQGNILIIEENPGNGIPQDSPNGGTIRFDFDRTLLSNVVVNKIGIVDNAQGHIFVKYMDGKEYVTKINHKYRNQLEFYDIPKTDVEYIEITFTGNGGVTGIEFDDLAAFHTSLIPEAEENEVIPIPEPSTIIGSLTALTLALTLKRLKRNTGV